MKQLTNNTYKEDRTTGQLTNITYNIPGFLEYYWFIQRFTIGSILFCGLHYMFALPLAILDFHRANNIGAYVGGMLVGLIVCNKQYNRIDYLFVRRKFRGLGVATELIKQSGCDLVCSCKASINFWKEQGYKRELGLGLMLKESDTKWSGD